MPFFHRFPYFLRVHGLGDEKADGVVQWHRVRKIGCDDVAKVTDTCGERIRDFACRSDGTAPKNLDLVLATRAFGELIHQPLCRHSLRVACTLWFECDPFVSIGGQDVSR